MAVTRRLKITAALVNGAAAILTVILFILLAPGFGPPPVADAPADRLAFALPLLGGPAALLLAMVLGTAVARALSDAYNPLTDAESPLYRASQRVLANTVEQSMVFLPVFLALAVALPADRLGWLELAVLLFLGARLLFWAGYLAHPYARAPGMTGTLTVNAGMLAALLA